MKEVTREVAAQADKAASSAVEAELANAAREGRTPDDHTLMCLHQAAWAGVTGADTVRIVSSAEPG